MGDELGAAVPAVFTVRHPMNGHGTAVVTPAEPPAGLRARPADGRP